MYWVVYWLNVAAWALGISWAQADVKCDGRIDGQYCQDPQSGQSATGGGGSW